MELTKQKIQQTVELLKRIEPGQLPIEIFYEFARLYVTPIIELVPIKRSADGQIKVLTVKRENNDPHWPGMIHTPGTVLRPTDETIDIAINRIIQKELPGIELNSDPIFVDFNFKKVKRGKELALVFYIEYKDPITDSEEIDPNSLPENFIMTQSNFIKKAIKKYEANNN